MAIKNRTLSVVTFLIFLASALSSSALAQREEMKVANDVKELQEQLSAASFDKRDEAEKQIIEIGTEALDFIADPSTEFEEDVNTRLTRIRKKLEQVAIEEAISPSKITLSGEMSLKTAFGEIKRQTGNSIKLAEGYDPAFLDKKKITLELEDATFWTAFEDILARSGLQSVVYGGEPGHAIVVPKEAVDPTKIDKAVGAIPPPNDQSGIFRIRVSGVSSAKNLLRPELDYTRVDLEVQWEPRLTPISIDMPMSKFKILDVDGKELKVSNPDQVLSGTVQAGINQVEMSVVLENIDRDVKTIGKVTGRLECVLPGRREKFRFPPVGDIEGEPSVSKAGITVQYLGFEENEDLFAVNLRVALEKDGKFESHHGWIYDNPLFQVDDAGKKESSVGHQGGGLDEDGVQIQYLFIEDPTKFGLLYESPGAIVSLPAEFSLKDIPLP